jgi:hypothetical protein
VVEVKVVVEDPSIGMDGLLLLSRRF